MEQPLPFCKSCKQGFIQDLEVWPQQYCESCRVKFCPECFQETRNLSVGALKAELEAVKKDFEAACEGSGVDEKVQLGKTRNRVEVGIRDAIRELEGSARDAAAYNTLAKNLSDNILSLEAEVYPKWYRMRANALKNEAMTADPLYKPGILKEAQNQKEQSPPVRPLCWPVKPFEIDDTEHQGYDHCAKHRPISCHGCEGIGLALETQLCKRCNVERPFCDKCKLFRTGRICMPASDKIGPAFTAKIDFSELVLPPVQDCEGGKGKPLHIGMEPPIKPDATSQQALVCAQACYTSLMKLVVKMAQKQGKSNLEATFAIALIETNESFKIVVTYSQETIVGTPLKLREHESLGGAVLEANPALVDSSGKCTILWKDGDELIGRKTKGNFYSKERSNLHHAEIRAYCHALRLKGQVRYIAPSRECCPLCHESLKQLNCLDKVPHELRGTRAIALDTALGDTDAEQEVVPASKKQKNDPIRN